jgi:hypothetical protein
VTRERRGHQGLVDRADGKRGQGRCAGKGWTGLELEP